ncbi:MAG: VWA domain-containing protein [Desulfobacteraceae bacterium]|nr:VWA domain-containing protein [Desulfobacteraceae bacterium]MBC2755636.1 VWA domain-containing protein [Desulfobacteraceae bacterium]
MKSKQIKPLILIGCLIAITCIGMASSGNLSQKNISRIISPPTQTVSNKNGIVTLSCNLVQDKIVSGSDGIVSLGLTMTADSVLDGKTLEDAKNLNNVDMVIVLDRSGSMSGQKINYAKNAAIELISKLTASDRFALVTYSDTAQSLSGLINVTPSAQRQLNAMIADITVGGGTNLSQGLQVGIDILTSSKMTGNSGRLILISDGLTNKGITSINALGNMASFAVKNEFSISTAGVGNDFNEQLMTAIADHGTGNYYFLENPSAFAAVFNNEFEQTRTSAATCVKISFQGKNSIKLVNAGGYPIETKNNTAVFFPGDLMSGETRKLFLSLKFPTDQVAIFDISGISLQYHYNGDPYCVSLSSPLKLACVKDPQAAIASIDKETWEHKVLKEDYSRLKEAVAGDIRSGRKQNALKKIDRYYTDQQAINASVQSDAVTDNLDHDLKQLRETVDETFTGKPEAVAEKQKKNAKVLQYEGYKERRKN